MPRSLVSYWKRVAVSGATADNREITRQELVDCAETYSLSTYTGVIWNEHDRDLETLGTVYAIRLVEDDPELEPGQVALEAQLKPNDDLLYLNDRGKKLFSSVEITPNFANSGRFYLTGIAVTDSPASLGTQELYFSKRGRKGNRYDKTSYYCSAVELGSLREGSQQQGEIRRFFSALTGLCKRFADTTNTTTSPDETKPMDEATAKALKALYDQFVILLAGLQAVLEPVVEDVDDADNKDQVDAVGAAVQDVVDEADENREFNRKGGKGSKGKDEVKELSARVEELTETMTKMFNTAPNRRPVKRNTGPADNKKRGGGLR